MGLKAMLIRVLASWPCLKRSAKFLVNGNGVRKREDQGARLEREKENEKEKKNTSSSRGTLQLECTRD
jgi:hypothetical protein